MTQITEWYESEHTERRLVEEAHRVTAAVVKAGDTAVDATVGNGHDTKHLSELVGATGTVLAFDVQQQSIEAAQRRLGTSTAATVVFSQTCHSSLAEHPTTKTASAAGRLTAVMFNLGYLPGSDRSIRTAAPTTSTALAGALNLLSPRGVATVLVYRGHAGGQEEAAAVREVLKKYAHRGRIRRIVGSQDDGKGPVLWTFHAADN